MRVATLFSALCTAAVASAELAKIYIQPVSTSPSTETPPDFLADIEYHVADSSVSEVVSYEFPEIPEDVETVRIGLYDSSSKSWIASSLASVENFNKGYAPVILLSVDQAGRPIGVTFKGTLIDAGQTRDFGPKAIVSVTRKGAQPELNKPIVLSPEGKKVVEEEKTLLQKFVSRCLSLLFMDLRLLIVSQVLVGNSGRYAFDDVGWRRGKIESWPCINRLLVHAIPLSVLTIFTSQIPKTDTTR